MHDDNNPELVWDRYENHVKTDEKFDSNLKSAILQLTSKFNEWDGDPWIHLSDKSLSTYFEKIGNYTRTPIKIQSDGSITLRVIAFNEGSKIYDEFQENISNIDKYIKDKISDGRVKIRVAPEIWIPKVELILKILEKYCH